MTKPPTPPIHENVAINSTSSKDALHNEKKEDRHTFCFDFESSSKVILSMRTDEAFKTAKNKFCYIQSCKDCVDLYYKFRDSLNQSDITTQIPHGVEDLQKKIAKKRAVIGLSMKTKEQAILKKFDVFRVLLGDNKHIVYEIVTYNWKLLTNNVIRKKFFEKLQDLSDDELYTLFKRKASLFHVELLYLSKSVRLCKLTEYIINERLLMKSYLYKTYVHIHNFCIDCKEIILYKPENKCKVCFNFKTKPQPESALSKNTLDLYKYILDYWNPEATEVQKTEDDDTKDHENITTLEVLTVLLNTIALKDCVSEDILYMFEEFESFNNIEKAFAFLIFAIFLSKLWNKSFSDTENIFIKIKNEQKLETEMDLKTWISGMLGEYDNIVRTGNFVIKQGFHLSFAPKILNIVGFLTNFDLLTEYMKNINNVSFVETLMFDFLQAFAVSNNSLVSSMTSVKEFIRSIMKESYRLNVNLSEKTFFNEVQGKIIFSVFRSGTYSVIISLLFKAINKPTSNTFLILFPKIYKLMANLIKNSGNILVNDVFIPLIDIKTISSILHLKSIRFIECSMFSFDRYFQLFIRRKYTETLFFMVQSLYEILSETTDDNISIVINLLLFMKFDYTEFINQIELPTDTEIEIVENTTTHFFHDYNHLKLQILEIYKRLNEQVGAILDKYYFYTQNENENLFKSFKNVSLKSFFCEEEYGKYGYKDIGFVNYVIIELKNTCYRNAIYDNLLDKMYQAHAIKTKLAYYVKIEPATYGIQLKGVYGKNIDNVIKRSQYLSINNEEDSILCYLSDNALEKNMITGNLVVNQEKYFLLRLEIYKRGFSTCLIYDSIKNKECLLPEATSFFNYILDEVNNFMLYHKQVPNIVYIIISLVSQQSDIDLGFYLNILSLLINLSDKNIENFIIKTFLRVKNIENIFQHEIFFTILRKKNSMEKFLDEMLYQIFLFFERCAEKKFIIKKIAKERDYGLKRIKVDKEYRNIKKNFTNKEFYSLPAFFKYKKEEVYECVVKKNLSTVPELIGIHKTKLSPSLTRNQQGFVDVSVKSVEEEDVMFLEFVKLSNKQIMADFIETNERYNKKCSSRVNGHERDYDRSYLSKDYSSSESSSNIYVARKKGVSTRPGVLQFQLDTPQKAVGLLTQRTSETEKIPESSGIARENFSPIKDGISHQRPSQKIYEAFSTDSLQEKDIISKTDELVKPLPIVSRKNVTVEQAEKLDEKSTANIDSGEKSDASFSKTNNLVKKKNMTSKSLVEIVLDESSETEDFGGVVNVRNLFDIFSCFSIYKGQGVCGINYLNNSKKESFANTENIKFTKNNEAIEKTSGHENLISIAKRTEVKTDNVEIPDILYIKQQEKNYFPVISAQECEQEAQKTGIPSINNISSDKTCQEDELREVLCVKDVINSNSKSCISNITTESSFGISTVSSNVIGELNNNSIGNSPSSLNLVEIKKSTVHFSENVSLSNHLSANSIVVNNSCGNILVDNKSSKRSPSDDTPTKNISDEDIFFEKCPATHNLSEEVFYTNHTNENCIDTNLASINGSLTDITREISTASNTSDQKCLTTAISIRHSLPTNTLNNNGDSEYTSNKKLMPIDTSNKNETFANTLSETEAKIENSNVNLVYSEDSVIEALLTKTINNASTSETSNSIIEGPRSVSKLASENVYSEGAEGILSDREFCEKSIISEDEVKKLKINQDQHNIVISDVNVLDNKNSLLETHSVDTFRQTEYNEQSKTDVLTTYDKPSTYIKHSQLEIQPKGSKNFSRTTIEQFSQKMPLKIEHNEQAHILSKPCIFNNKNTYQTTNKISLQNAKPMEPPTKKPKLNVKKPIASETSIPLQMVTLKEKNKEDVDTGSKTSPEIYSAVQKLLEREKHMGKRTTTIVNISSKLNTRKKTEFFNSHQIMKSFDSLGFINFILNVSIEKPVNILNAPNLYSDFENFETFFETYKAFLYMEASYSLVSDLMNYSPILNLKFLDQLTIDGNLISYKFMTCDVESIKTNNIILFTNESFFNKKNKIQFIKKPDIDEDVADLEILFDNVLKSDLFKQRRRDYVFAHIKQVHVVKDKAIAIIQTNKQLYFIENVTKIVHITSISSTLKELKCLFDLSNYKYVDSLIKPSLHHKLRSDFLDKIDDDKISAACETMENEFKLNPSQKSAINSCLAQEFFTLIQGPPGTGKTTTIIALTSIFIQMGLKVMISAPSNTAVDHLTRLLIQDDKFKDIVITRLGILNSVSEDIRHLMPGHLTNQERIRNQLNSKELINNYLGNKSRKLYSTAKIFTSTLNSSLVTEIVNTVDILIVDEVCQAVDPTFFVSLSLNPKKIILIGDPKQLPPTILNGNHTAYETTFFSRLGQHQPVNLLNIQYRMHPDIAAFPSQYFYNDQIQNGVSVEAYQDILKNVKIPYFPCSFINTNGKEERSYNSYLNKTEVDLVFYLIDKIYFNKHNLNLTIGIITPYSAQARVLNERLKGLSFDIQNNIKVSTVDGFQGQEKDFIIFSTVRTEKIGFLKDERRVNVAFTRARYGLCVLGNKEVLNSPVWLNFYKYVKAKNGLLSLNIKT
ncbi:ATP-dependent helicase NAM7 [Cucumispora dikerogammari]|nr:ATP-dependent helicase NAM7 [Cucumispora dikerogammari]